MIDHKPISNGTMGSMWQDAWCDRCAMDHTMHAPEPEGPGCSIVMKMMVYDDGDSIDELTDRYCTPDHDHGGAWGACCLVCRAFTPCAECNVPTDYDPKEG